MIQTRMFVRRSTSLPLVVPWLGGAARAQPEGRNPTCRRCQLGEKAQTVCMQGDGEAQPSGPPGGLLVVGSSPTTGDDQSGQPFSTELGRQLRRLVERFWPGPVRYCYAVSCRGGAAITEQSFDACAPYLAGEVERTNPARILVVGPDAARGLFGHRVQPIQVRRAWAFVRDRYAACIPHPQAALHNRFVKKWLDEDCRWALTGPIPAVPHGRTIVHWDQAGAVEWLRSLQPGQPISLDIETAGDCFEQGFRLLCLGMTTRADEPHVLPAEVLEDRAVRVEVARVLADPRLPKGGQFVKYDLNGLHREFGVELAGLEFDTGFQARLLESDSPAKLGVLAWQVGYGGYKALTDASMEDDQDKSTAYAKLDPDDLHAYNGRDCAVTHLVRERQARPGRFDPYLPVWTRLVRPAISALAQVERWGALLNRDSVQAYDRWLANRQQDLQARLHQVAEVSPTLNPNSDDQVRDLLFVRLGLPVKVMTSGGAKKKGVPKPSVGRAAMEGLKKLHPVVGILMELAKVEKQRSTYGLGTLDYIGQDGRVHATYNIIRSGRLSCREPNMQNVTAKGEEGVWARGCWSAPPGHKLISLDYAQLELRILADLSGDQVMNEAFERGSDFHLETACEMARVQKGMRRQDFIEAYGNGTDGEKWAIDLRKAAKNTNFGLVFGQGDAALAEILGVTKATATGFKQMVLSAYPKMAAYQARLIADARVTGEVWTEWNGCRRRRSIWKMGELGDDDQAGADKSHAQNVARNHPVQGTASEYCLASLIEVVGRQQDGDLAGRLTITVHDELVLEVPTSQVEQVAREVKGIMQGWPTRLVKLRVDCEVGDDWGHMTKLAI
jgi:DNA polymerase-1